MLAALQTRERIHSRRGWRYLPARTRVANCSDMTPRALLAVVLLLAAACATAPPATQAVGTITYEVTGGFSGQDRLLIVDHDGTAHMGYVTRPSAQAKP